MDHPTTTAAALAIAALLAVVAARYYRRSRQLQRQIAVLEDESYLQGETLNETQQRLDKSLQCVNLLQQANQLMASTPRPVSIMRFNGTDYACYNVKAYYRN